MESEEARDFIQYNAEPKSRRLMAVSRLFLALFLVVLLRRFAGQPLAIVGPTGPFLAYTLVCYDLAAAAARLGIRLRNRTHTKTML